MEFQYQNQHQNHSAAHLQGIRQRKHKGIVDLRSSTQQTRQLIQLMQTSEEVRPLQRVNKTGIPDGLKSGMENLSGMSLDHVKVHYNSSKPAAVQAHAFAQGSDIHVAPGQSQHLPHELGHVVQQAAGQVQPTTTVAGMAVNDNPSLESEATRMGNQALRGG